MFRSRRFFSFWFGIGVPPFLAGTVIVAFYRSITFGVVTALVTSFWVFDTFSTTCRRCPFYGSATCGIPGLIVPFVLSRQSAFSISLLRVRLHYYADVAMILYVNFVYWYASPLFPVVAMCSLIGWLVVFQPRRFHGLLFRLHATESNVVHEPPTG